MRRSPAILAASETRRPYEPGTTGWAASDLDDPRIERQWLRGRYEIVEGVLTKLPAPSFAEGEAVSGLVFLTKAHLRGQGVRGGFASGIDIILDEERVARADAVYMDAAAKKRQAASM